MYNPTPILAHSVTLTHDANWRLPLDLFASILRLALWFTHIQLVSCRVNKAEVGLWAHSVGRSHEPPLGTARMTRSMTVEFKNVLGPHL